METWPFFFRILYKHHDEVMKMLVTIALVVLGYWLGKRGAFDRFINNNKGS